MIALWSGSIATIPRGWSLCNGENGTPDLRDQFVPAAGTTYNPGDSGGNVLHSHGFTGDGHDQSLVSGDGMLDGTDYEYKTTNTQITGTTDNGSTPGPYYSLAYIMEL